MQTEIIDQISCGKRESYMMKIQLLERGSFLKRRKMRIIKGSSLSIISIKNLYIYFVKESLY
ncbi:hypothetical protein C1640_03500 [Bacillus sp. AKBS9]|nr:hypothetical protein C1640_03500 [Bacillus sp. AKBS9]